MKVNLLTKVHNQHASRDDGAFLSSRARPELVWDGDCGGRPRAGRVARASVWPLAAGVAVAALQGTGSWRRWHQAGRRSQAGLVGATGFSLL